MPDIKNNTDAANEMVRQIDCAKRDLRLPIINKRAADNVSVDEDCDQSYVTGVIITAKFRAYLSTVSEFAGSVSQQLDAADQQVFKSLPSLGSLGHGLGGVHEQGR